MMELNKLNKPTITSDPTHCACAQDCQYFQPMQVDGTNLDQVTDTES